MTNFLTTIVGPPRALVRLLWQERIHLGQGYAPMRERSPCSRAGGLFRRRRTEPNVGQEARRKLISNPSVENFLRLSEEPCAFQREARSSFQTAPSVENLLRCWEAEETPRTPAEVDVQYLKHLELCSWFSVPHGRRRNICRDVTMVQRALASRTPVEFHTVLHGHGP